MAIISIATNVSASGSADRAPSSHAADLATLVADGASPTQAHVTALNNDFMNQAAVVLHYDTSKVTSLNLLRTALDALWLQARGRGEIK